MILTFEKGTLLLVDYTAKIKDGDIVDTTREAEAKEHSIHDSSVRYGPELISVGDPNFPALRGFDEALASSTSDTFTIEVEPEKGFGKRDSGKVRMIPLRKLGDDAEKVTIGDEIDIDGKHGIIRYIGSGRVQIDYNHRLAGNTLVYDAHIVNTLKEDNEKINAILARRLRLANDEIKVTVESSNAQIKIPEKLFRNEDIQRLKHLIQLDIFKFVPSLTNISFVENYVNKKATPDTTKTSESPKV